MALNDIQHGFLTKNMVVINGDVDGPMVSYLKEALGILYAIKKVPDITVLISSPGGSVDAGLDIIDLLNRYPGKKTGVVTVYARSMAAVILQVCDERLMTTHASIMIHHISKNQVSLDLLRDNKKVRKLREEMEKSQERIYSILAKRTGKTVKVIRKECENERDMPAHEAIAFGLVDGITTTPLPK